MFPVLGSTTKSPRPPNPEAMRRSPSGVQRGVTRRGAESASMDRAGPRCASLCIVALSQAAGSPVLPLPSALSGGLSTQESTKTTNAAANARATREQCRNITPDDITPRDRTCSCSLRDRFGCGHDDRNGDRNLHMPCRRGSCRCAGTRGNIRTLRRGIS